MKKRNAPGHTLLHALTWLVAGALALWIVTRLPAESLLQTVAQLQAGQWLLWITLNLLVILLLAGRWCVLTRAMGLTITLGSLLRIRQAGGLISFVTPGPQFGGEPLQVYWLWQRYKVPGHAAFLAVGLDRFFELSVNFAILLLAVLALLLSAAVESVNWIWVATILLALLALMAAAVWIVLRQPVRVRDWVVRLVRPWQKSARLKNLDAHWSQLQESLQQVVRTQRPALMRALLLSVMAWLAMIVEFWLLLRFVGIEQQLLTFVFLFTVVRLAFLLPLPGGVGSVEAGLFWALQLLALPLSAAAGLIVLMRLRDVVILLSGAALLPGLQKPLADTLMVIRDEQT